ncbi:MAG: efflux RND transporter periplasmic adaptor subunit [Gemmobacter sp.]
MPGLLRGVSGDVPRAAARAPATVQVVAEPVAAQPRVERHVALGRLHSADLAPIVARIGGRVLEVQVAPGSRVAAGDPILHLNDADERAALARAEAEEAEARDILTRTEALAATGTASRAQLAAARAAAARAALDREAAGAALAARTLRAPIAGRIGLIAVRPGAVIAAGTVIAEIRDETGLTVSFDLSERAAAAVAPGDRVAVRAVMVDTPPHPARVTALEGRIDPATGMMAAEARIEGDGAGLSPGQRVTVELRREHAPLPAVDPLAVGWGRSGPFVWVLREGRAQPIPVAIVARQGDRLLVQGDLAPGDLVAVEGTQRLRPGAPVVTLDAPPAPEPAPVQLVRRGLLP